MKELGGGTVFFASFRGGGGADYAGIAAALAKAEPDGILLMAPSRDAALFMQQFYKMKLMLPTFSSAWPMTSDLLSHGGPAVEGFYTLGFFDPQSQNETSRQFVKRYKEQFKAEPSFSSVFAYDSVKILLAAAEKAPEIKPESIKQTLLTSSSWAGLQVPIKINQYGDADRPWVLYTVKKGEFVKVQ